MQRLYDSSLIILLNFAQFWPQPELREARAARAATGLEQGVGAGMEAMVATPYNHMAIVML
jgi:hypothetical protein